MTAGEVDLRAPEATSAPFPLLRALREADPVHWSHRHGAWLLTRYDDVHAALKDRRLEATDVPASGRPEDTMPFNRFRVFRDPAIHSRVRMAVTKSFTRRTVERLRPHAQRIVDSLIDDLPEDDVVDLVAKFASVVPSAVLAQLLGIPAVDRGPWDGWMEATGKHPGGDRMRLGLPDLNDLADYFRSLVERRAGAPGSDLLGALLASGELEREEIVATAIVFLFAGHDTITTLVSAGVLALLRNQSQRERLATEPELIRSAVEEFLRYDPPSKAIARCASEDLELRGRRVRPGDRVYLVLAAANRDPERFSDPDALDVARHPNLHLSFGAGGHTCLGASLARLEAAVAIETLLRRRPALRLSGEPVRIGSLVGGLASLPVVPGPASPERAPRRVGPTRRTPAG